MTLKKKKRSKPTAKPMKYQKYQKSSLKENKEINKYFQNFFDTGECPGKADWLKAMQLNRKRNNEIHKRHWENIIKKKVNNEMTSRMKK